MGFFVLPGFLALNAAVTAFRTQPWAATDLNPVNYLLFVPVLCSFRDFPGQSWLNSCPLYAA
jgi:hypothetical protein